VGRVRRAARLRAPIGLDHALTGRGYPACPLCNSAALRVRPIILVIFLQVVGDSASTPRSTHVQRYICLVFSCIIVLINQEFHSGISQWYNERER